jgi:hypothetical protein
VQGREKEEEVETKAEKRKSERRRSHSQSSKPQSKSRSQSRSKSRGVRKNANLSPVTLKKSSGGGREKISLRVEDVLKEKEKERVTWVGVKEHERGREKVKLEKQKEREEEEFEEGGECITHSSVDFGTEEGEDMDWREMAEAYGGQRFKEEEGWGWGGGRGRGEGWREGGQGSMEDFGNDDAPPNMLIKLNVGGRKYLTTMLTLKSLVCTFLLLPLFFSFPPDE